VIAAAVMPATAITVAITIDVRTVEVFMDGIFLYEYF
jgi:hypothetical protein